MIELPVYDEDMIIHDDVTPHLFLLEQHGQTNLNVTLLWNSHIMLKNLRNKGSVTTFLNDKALIEVERHDTKVLLSKAYSERFGKLWGAGSESLVVKVEQLDDTYIKKTSLALHKSVFLETHAEKLHHLAWDLVGLNYAMYARREDT